MINKKDIINIQKLLNNKKITDSKLLSASFNINCIRITTDDKKKFVVKYYNKKNKKFNAILSETKNLDFFNTLDIEFFPKIYSKSDDYLIMSYIINDGNNPNITRKDFLDAIIKIHSFRDNKYGFGFDTQLGGLKQINTINNNWVEFYGEKRLGYIFNLINRSNSMDSSINNKIELLLKNLKNFIPQNPKASLLHGDMWEGNILFNEKKFVAFIDPGTFYGHNELEIAYLTWFNPDFIKNGFLEKYNEIIKIDKDFKYYEPVYQLYYSLLNVHLWDRRYIKDVDRLLKIIKV